MALVQSNQLFPNRTPLQWVPAQVPVVQEFSWEPVFWTVAGLGALALLANALEPAQRQCGTCGRVGHDTRTCSLNASKRVRSRMVKTGWCSCCECRFRRTEAHHYAGPADGSKGREMCGTCHLICGHGGHWQNMATNPRYCRL